MECFVHPGTNAVGVCKACAKGVCRACAIDAGVGVACSEKCSREAREQDEMIQRSKAAYGIGYAKKAIPHVVVMWSVFGSVFLGWGLYSTAVGKTIDWFPIIMGAAALAMAVFGYLRVKDTGLRV
jgi:hypothetical protein